MYEREIERETDYIGGNLTVIPPVRNPIRLCNLKSLENKYGNKILETDMETKFWKRSIHIEPCIISLISPDVCDKYKHLPYNFKNNNDFFYF